MSEPTVKAPQLKSYTGNCHCGAIKYNFKAPESPTVFECNCSICFKKGYKHFFPEAESLEFIKGEEDLRDYEFANKTMLHRFCPSCGTPVMGKRHSAPPGKAISVNARTLNDVDIWSLPIKTFNGKALEPCYEPTPFTGPEPSAEIENSKTYTGGCHCGNVTMALKTQDPISGGHEYIQECNCSICMRNGTILTYPRDNQVSISAKREPKGYIFGRKYQYHMFCDICGVNLYLKKIPGSVDVKKHPEWDGEMPINLRCFDGVEWDQIEIKKGNWKEEGIPYVVPA